MWVAVFVALIITDPLMFHTHARVPGDMVRLGDVADVSSLPESLRDRAASTPVARTGGQRRVLSSRRMSERARAAMPALSGWLPSSPDQLVQVDSDMVQEAPAQSARTASPHEPDISRGDALTIRVAIGPVVVEREVHALQSGRRGRPIFVRTAEGRVLSARVAGGE